MFSLCMAHVINLGMEQVIKCLEIPLTLTMDEAINLVDDESEEVTTHLGWKLLIIGRYFQIFASICPQKYFKLH